MQVKLTNIAYNGTLFKSNLFDSGFGLDRFHHIYHLC